MTTLEKIKEWYLEGKKEKYKYLTVMCDEFDWSDYPVYGDKPVKGNPEKMQKVMEVYDLSIPFELQNNNKTYNKSDRLMKFEVRDKFNNKYGLSLVADFKKDEKDLQRYLEFLVRHTINILINNK